MKIEKMNKGEWGKVRAYFDLRTSDGIVIKGFKLIEGDGLFVGLPSVKDKDGNYNNSVFMEREVKNAVYKLAKDHYEGWTEDRSNNILQEQISNQPNFGG